MRTYVVGRSVGRSVDCTTFKGITPYNHSIYNIYDIVCIRVVYTNSNIL